MGLERLSENKRAFSGALIIDVWDFKMVIVRGTCGDLVQGMGVSIEVSSTLTI